MALFCTSLRDSVSLLRFSFRSHVQVFSRDISPVFSHILLLLFNFQIVVFSFLEFFTRVLPKTYNYVAK